MSIHEGLRKAVQDDARRAGEHDRLLLEARRARTIGRQPAGLAAAARRLAAILRRTTAQPPVTLPSPGEITGSGLPEYR
jgi:hypothetical protein